MDANQNHYEVGVGYNSDYIMEIWIVLPLVNGDQCGKVIDINGKRSMQRTLCLIIRME